MIAGIGTDIVSVNRFKDLNDRFMRRCYTDGETSYLRGKPINSAAGLFAAKEAVVKALGTGFTGFWPRDVEIEHGTLNEPLVKLHNNAREVFEQLRLTRIFVSISHNETTSVAFAVAEKDG